MYLETSGTYNLGSYERHKHTNVGRMPINPQKTENGHVGNEHFQVTRCPLTELSLGVCTMLLVQFLATASPQCTYAMNLYLSDQHNVEILHFLHWKITVNFVASSNVMQQTYWYIVGRAVTMNLPLNPRIKEKQLRIWKLRTKFTMAKQQKLKSQNTKEMIHLHRTTYCTCKQQ